VIEATYAAQITPWLVVEPDIQLILNPGGVTKSSDALVLGARAIINF
jgi:porin